MPCETSLYTTSDTSSVRHLPHPWTHASAKSAFSSMTHVCFHSDLRMTPGSGQVGIPVAVVRVVAASSPQPIRLQRRRTRTPAAAARRQLAVSTRPTDGVHDACRRYAVSERGFAARCKKTQRSSRFNFNLSARTFQASAIYRDADLIYCRAMKEKRRNSTAHMYGRDEGTLRALHA
jgi:hypothetical protein